MGLIDHMKEPCVFMVPTRTPDGSGGFVTAWEDGESFMATVVRDTSTEARIAEAAGVVSVYTVTVSRSVMLPFHAAFKRLSDGKTFRITSDNAEKKTPVCAGLDMAQATAEAWGLTV